MTPKEKANKLVSQYEICTRPLFALGDYENEKHYNKQCALILAIETKLQFMEIADYDKAAYWRLIELELEKL